MKAPKFELRGSGQIRTIQCRVTNGINNVARMSTGLQIDKDRWDSSKQTTVGITATERNINTKLRYITELVENDVTIRFLTSEWLKNIIDIATGNIKIDDKLLFTNICQEYIDSKHKLKPNTLVTYNRAKTLLTEFIGDKRKQVIDIDTTFMNDFEKWLKSVKGISTNTAILHTRFIVIILNYCNDVKGFEISRRIKYNPKRTEKKKGEIVMLDELEVQAIKDLQNLSNALENSRTLFLVGIEIGQRGNDLLSIKPSNIKDNRIYLTQQKTGKDVIIPVTDKVLELYKNINYKVDIKTLRRNIKKLCELAKIDTPVLMKQNLKGVETIIEVPKWKVVGTHTMRRTFVSLNYGKIATPLIMSITKHKTEEMLIRYIGLTDEELANQFEIEKNKNLNK